MNPILSVVIPVYKVEDYLERCVNSVLNQDFTGLEVILVDDGSPDRCPQMCDELASQDPRVKVIHKKNGGASSARNEGIRFATGEFITFLDSDDQWLPNQLSLLMRKVQDTTAQIVFFASKSLYEDSGYYVRDNHGLFEINDCVLTPLQIYPLLIKYGDLHEHAGTKIIKTNFLRDNKLFFKEGMTCEDTEWFLRVLRQEVTISIANVYLYVYTEGRIGSVVNSASTGSLRDELSIIRASILYYQINPKAPTKSFELAHCSYLWAKTLGSYRNTLRKDRNEIRKEIIEVGKSLDLNAHPKAKIAGIVYKLFGFNMASFILSCYIKLHKKNLINKKIKVNG